MKFSIGSVNLSIERNLMIGHSSSTFEELDAEIWADMWSPPPREGNPHLLTSITVDSDDADPVVAGRLLSEHGIVVVPGFFDQSRALGIADGLFPLVNQLASAKSSSNSPANLRVSTGEESYASLVKREGPTAVVRRGSDEGLIDIFHFDRLCPGPGQQLREVLSSDFMRCLIAPSGTPITFKNLNVYINDGVTSTRMFHVDSYEGTQIKAFMYLTNVESISDGPYCYVLGSHHQNPFTQMNRALVRSTSGFRETDCPLVDVQKAVPILAPAGSLIISDQSGSHRGLPQTVGHKRAVAVLNTYRSGIG